MSRTCTFINRYNTECCTECGVGVELCQCVSLDEKAEKRLTGAEGVVAAMIRDELRAAREVSGGSTHLVATLVAQVGDMTEAMIQHDRSQGPTVQEVLRKIVKVGASAMRVAIQGDDNFLYEFPAVEEELPRGPVGGQYR